ncbi:MAG: chromosomal replication initiator protein DnaA [Tissierellia bacterium]|nr:chromosomal replication initiator protein DnaA [Tissierellia bacterium]
MQANVAWAKIQNELMLRYDTVAYNTWFSNLEVLNEDEHTIYLLASSSFNGNIINRRNYSQEFQEIYSNLTGEQKNFAVVTSQDISEMPRPNLEEKPGLKSGMQLNPRYTFDEFVVGASNMFAQAACVAVAEEPGKSYNPLFLYGGSGLGKTHLMQAIGHYIKEKDPSKRVMYISSERFTNDFINSIKSGKGEEFRNYYRNNVDVLLIDDIQFLADKEQTQIEFFHTFNDLHQANKQIVISSDSPPKEIKALEERLRSRFEWGLITDINDPDYETRVAILKKKAERDNKDISEDVYEFIAKNIKSNIRELEGALTRVVAYSSLVDKPINIALCEEALVEILDKTIARKIDSNYIREVVCRHFGVTEQELDSPKRMKSIAYPRQIAMYLIREMTDLSLPKIGEIFGGRDHSTVVHSCDKITKEVETNKNTRELIEAIKEDL